MEADRPFRRLFRKGKRLFRRGYGHEHRYRPSSQAGNYRGRPLGRLRSKAEVSLPPPFHHRRPPKHRSRSVARCRATDTGRPRRFPAPAPRCRGQLRARSGHPRADRARRAPHAHTFVARLPRLRLEPSGVLRAEGPGPPSHDAGPPRIAPGHLRRRRRLGAASRSASGLLVAPSGSRRRRLPLRHRRCRRGPEHGRGPVGAGHGALPVPERRLLGRRPLRPGHVGFHRGCSRGAGHGLRGRDR